MFVLELPAEVSGAYKPDGPAIFVNGTHAAARQRFTVAHEFGHHRLGHQNLKVIDTVQDIAGANDRHDPHEVQANAFAAEFLAPLQAAQEWWANSARTGAVLEDVCCFAHTFGMSALAGLFRLSTAGAVDDRLVTRLKREIEDDMHLDAAERLQLCARDDVLEKVRQGNPLRLPGGVDGGALSEVLAGRMSVDHAARLAGQPPDRLRGALEALRI